MTANTTSGLYPAVVRIIDIQTASFPLDSSVVFEAVQTSNGTMISVQVPLTAIMTTVQGALPTGGGTGQILNKVNATNYSTQWSSITQFVGVGTGLVTSGSATSIVLAFATQSALSVLGVAGNATKEPAAIVGTAAQVLRVNDAGNALAFGAINLASSAAVTGVLGVPFGGTNTSTLTAFGALYGNGTSTLGITAAGTTNWPLLGNGTAVAPAFGQLNLGSTGVTGTIAVGNLPIATEAQAEASVSTAVVMTPQASGQARIANVQTFGRNICGRNGGFEVWQRLANATTIAIPASSVSYCVDGFYLATGANQSSTLTQVAGLAIDSRFAARVQRNNAATGTTAMYFAMPLDIDELNKLRGNAAAVSFVASTGANWSPTSGTLTFNLYCGTGGVGKRGATAYTGESNPIAFSNNLTQSQGTTKYVSSPSSAIATNITQAEAQFTWTPATTAGANDWFAVDDLQLEVVPTGIATVAPLFERTDVVWDLERCQRFLPVFNASGGCGIAFGGCLSTSSGFAIIHLPTSTRIAVTGITISTASHFYASTNVGSVDTATAVSFANSQPNSVTLTFSVANASLVLGDATLFASQNSAAQILFTGAEL